MTSMLKMGLMTLAIGAALHSADSKAAVASHVVWSNAVNYCQAFTPGVTNTIRNRVIGSENVGTASIAVACNLASFDNGAAGNAPIDAFVTYFTNTSAAAVDVSCTMLTGTAGNLTGSTYTVSKVVTVPAGNSAALGWDPSDNPTAGATDLGDPYAVGVNCILPQHVTLSLIGYEWSADNGV
jgi:hypothetical protein